MAVFYSKLIWGRISPASGNATLGLPRAYVKLAALPIDRQPAYKLQSAQLAQPRDSLSFGRCLVDAKVIGIGPTTPIDGQLIPSDAGFT
jgi:hypothetical protein